jgi:acetyl-CoA carboxylase carboxyltransferase component
MANIGREAKRDIGFSTNEDSAKNHLRLLKAKAETVMIGGGRSAIEKQHAKGKLTARERIGKLIDPQSAFLEIGLFAAYGMYAEYGGAPSSGTVFGIGSVRGRDVVIVANDATVKAGT